MGLEAFETSTNSDRNVRWTEKEILDAINTLAEEKQSTPTLRQAVNCDYLPTNSTIRSKFGTWNNALDEAGFDVNEKHGHDLDSKHTSKTEKKNISVFSELDHEDSISILGEHSNKSKGEATEAIITGEFLKRNINVLDPYGENQRYDLVLDTGSEMIKVQCKKGKLTDDRDVVRFSAQSSSLRSDGYVKDSYDSSVDYFAVYVWEISELFIVHTAKVANTTGSLRLTKPKNNQVKGITFAAEHTVESFIDKLAENESEV